MRARHAAGLATLLLAACAGAPAALSSELLAFAADAPEDQPVRLAFAGERVVAAAVPLGPGSLPPAVRVAVEAVAPGGRALYAAREHGPRGGGYRVEKLYGDGPDQHFRSILVDDDGAVLERSHSVPLAEVPEAVLLAAVDRVRRQVQRVDVVSGPDGEEGFRVTLRDGGGRTFVAECSLDGGSCSVHRVVPAALAVPLAR